MSRAQNSGASPAMLPPTGAHAHGSPIVAASRLPSFHFQTRTRTVAGRFPCVPWKGQLRFAGPGSHSPPRWRTREHRCDLPLPSARRERFRGPAWPAHYIRPWVSLPLPVFTGRATLTLPPQDTRTEAFLRNLLTITRNRGYGQRNRPHPRVFSLDFGFTGSRAASRRPQPAQSPPGAWCPACFPGCGRYPAAALVRRSSPPTP